MKKKRLAKPEKRGRPRLEFDQKIADRICEQIIAGKSLRRICQAKAMPSVTTVMKWLRETPSFAEHYAGAREEQADGYADELIDLARKATESNSSAIRVRADIIKWVCSKLKPRKYGDRLELHADVNVVSAGSLPDKPFAEWSRNEQTDWGKRICLLMALIGNDVRHRLGLIALAEAYENLRHQIWRAIHGGSEKKADSSPRALPAPKALPVPVREPPEKEINPRPAQDSPPPFRGSREEQGL